MKDPLKKYTIAISGIFGDARPHEKIRRWIENNGGTSPTTINAQTTHLICSKEHWKKGVKIGE